MLSNEELLAARYKVIADYPLSDKYFKVGEILLWSVEGFYYAEKCKLHKLTVESYPHLFKKLEWWEERKVEELEPELWTPINGYGFLYEISTYGRVKSLSRVTTRKHKGVKEYNFIRKEKILKNQVKSDGYLKVELSKNNVTQILYIHRLVAEAFIPNPENKPNVNHIKSFTWFNWVGNLEWCTQSENLIHAINTNDYCNKIKTRKKPLFHARSKEHREFLANQSLNQIN